MPSSQRFAIGQRVLDLAKSRGMSQGDLAKEVGLKPGAVSAWGKSSGPPLDKIEKLAEVLNVTIEYLVTGSDSAVALPLTPPSAATPAAQSRDELRSVLEAQQKLIDTQQSVIDAMSRRLAVLEGGFTRQDCVG